MTAKVTTAVNIEGLRPLQAFELFTKEISSWWVRDPRYQFMPGGKGFLTFEPGPEGRLVELGEGEVFEVGRVLIWEPGQHLAFEWQGPNFEPDQKTRVDVWFKPTALGTRVLLEHSGWEQLPQDHPVRHGMPSLLFMKTTARWWLVLLRQFRKWGQKAE